jgi:hypothetical protein
VIEDRAGVARRGRAAASGEERDDEGDERS